MKSLSGAVDPLPPEKIHPTVGLNIGRVEVGRKRLVFWDLGGQTGLRTLWNKYFAEAHALLFVLDAADARRLDDARKTLEDVLESHDLKEVPLLVFANKQDLSHAIRLRDLEEFETLASKGSRIHRVIGVSALTGDGLQDGIAWLAECLRDHARRVKAT